MNDAPLPSRFDTVEALEDFMTRPSEALIADLAAVDGDIIVLGVGGKMGPTLARLAKRAAPDKTVVGVSRFSESGLEERLRHHGIEPISADLNDREAVGRLPQVRNVIFMAGRKFGSTGNEPLTWAANAYVPTVVAQAFKESRIVAYSTACVYPFVPVTGGGAAEDTPVDPPGEYAMSCVARERLFEYFSGQLSTPGRLIRLSYAIDMRYGVLYDVASAVMYGREVDVRTGHANVIWQGDAASQSLRALRHVTKPTSALNVSGPDAVSIRGLAEAFGRKLGKTPVLAGEESPTGWLVNTTEAVRLFGEPTVPLETMIDWTADWVAREMPNLEKPTHFEARSGRF